MIREQTNLFYTFLLHDRLNVERIESDDVCVEKEEVGIEEDYVKTSTVYSRGRTKKENMLNIDLV